MYSCVVVTSCDDQYLYSCVVVTSFVHIADCMGLERSYDNIQTSKKTDFIVDLISMVGLTVRLALWL